MTRTDPHMAELPSGFTLLELMIVVLLLTVMLGFSVPNFRNMLPKDDLKACVRKLVSATRQVRQASISQGRVYNIHFDMHGSRFWITHSAMSKSEAEISEQRSFDLGTGIYIEDIRFPIERNTKTNHSILRFFPQGYADQAMVVLKDGNQQRSYILFDMFLQDVKILNDVHEVEPYWAL